MLLVSQERRVKSEDILKLLYIKTRPIDSERKHEAVYTVSEKERGQAN